MDAQHLRDMALHIWGPDSQPAMREFQPSDRMLIKYQHTILDCERAIRGRRVLDLGCHHGVWSYAAHRHGASHVVGVEPRGMFVDGLNGFARQHALPMEFHRGYDTDLARLVREHHTDTVIMMSMDHLIDWESTLRDLRDTPVRWLILQAEPLPDEWVRFGEQARSFGDSGHGMPLGFTLWYPKQNSGTRAAINPQRRELADPWTGFQHTDASTGRLDLTNINTIVGMKSRNYIRAFIDHVGFTVEHSHTQAQSVGEAPARTTTNGLLQWYLLHNAKRND